MNASFVPFGSLPGGLIIALLALIVAGAFFTLDIPGHDKNEHNDDTSL